MVRHTLFIALVFAVGAVAVHAAEPAPAPQPAPSPQATAQGPAIPLSPGDDPWVITKLRVTDSRAVRGFVGAPVDGSLKSASWDGKTWEYPVPGAGAAVGYNYRNADGLHLTFADDTGFNAVVVRGGIKAKLLRNVQHYDDPTTGQTLCEFPGQATTSRAWFNEPVKTRTVSFFDVSDGLIADTSFFRVRRGLADLRATPAPLPTTAPTGSDAPTNARPHEPITLATPPLTTETSLTAIGVDFELASRPSRPLTFTVSVQDPLNPRLELHGADYTVTEPGRYRIACDFPDQVIPAGRPLSVTLTFDQPATPRNLHLEQYPIPRERAIAEALEHRKFILHALYVPICEARPWNPWNAPGDDEKYFNQPADTGDPLQDRLRPFVREIVTTLNQCRALDPEGKDPIVRQYHEWIYRKILTKSPGGLPPFPTKYDAIPGVPEWASLVHQAWMQAREVPRWWIEHRMTPNGELGGEVGDDTDMFGNYAPFPMLERDGVGGLCLDAAARLAETADRDTLELGINKRSMDPLHAYEEGMNQEALLAYWNYGDPVYLERCMTAARSTERLTMVTDKGHRHFRGNTLGIDETRNPRPPEGEHGSHCLMWHPTLIAAWYNRNPLAMQWLKEWGDGWLDHMKPGDEGHTVKLPDDVTSKADPLPFSGGWGMTGSVFTFLADLTGDPRYVRPYTDYFTSTGKNTGIHLAELLQMGMLPSPEKTVATVKGPWIAALYATNNNGPWNAPLYTTGDKAPFLKAIKKDIEELQRFPHMYTAVECYTDRVFLYPIINPSIAYTGGYTTRNKLNLTYAVSWNGFGTDYAALVTSATSAHLKVFLCNLSDRRLTGQARLWRLDPGDYELTLGPDANNDDQADQTDRKETLTIARGDEITLTIPPKVVQILELKQVRKGPPLFSRPDLALSRRELKVTADNITGVAHNIGSQDVDDVVVSLLDKHGNTIQSKHLGRLAAPLDLRPQTLPFQFDAAQSDLRGGSVVLDPQGTLPEIFKGNNRIPID